jgi:hypothetical protein
MPIPGLMTRNPKYFDFENMGGDCTNSRPNACFPERVMNYGNPRLVLQSLSSRSPSWTGVPVFYIRSF